jgi:hypothetical protein
MTLTAAVLRGMICPTCGADASHIVFNLENPRTEPRFEDPDYPGSLLPPKRAP